MNLSWLQKLGGAVTRFKCRVFNLNTSHSPSTAEQGKFELHLSSTSTLLFTQYRSSRCPYLSIEPSDFWCVYHNKRQETALCGIEMGGSLPRFAPNLILEPISLIIHTRSNCLLFQDTNSSFSSSLP